MRTRAACLLAVLGLALLAGACGGKAGEGDPYGESTVVQERAVVGSPGEVEGGTPEPERFGFGSPVSSERIAAWDRDVGPDGIGLPPGRGSVAEGEELFRRVCATCHGPTGVEGPNDRLVGREPRDGFPFGRSAELRDRRTIGNYWPFATTLFDYITRAMPQNEPGSLSADETYAVIAYLLFRNEIVPGDAVLDAAALNAVRMPARDRFVADDRRGGPEIR